jgi:hypothetical protein
MEKKKQKFLLNDWKFPYRLKNTLTYIENVGRTNIIIRRGPLTGTLPLLSCLNHASSA